MRDCRNLKTIFLTGGAGFLGTHLLATLHANNYKVLATTRGDLSALPSKLLDGRTDWISAKDAVYVIEKSRPLAVIHLATNYGGESSLHDTLLANEAWPLSLLEASIRAGVHVFLNTDTFFAKPAFAYSHMRAYTLSKSCFLAWGKHAVANTQTRFITLRLEHVFGENDKPTKFVPSLLRKLKRNELVEATEGHQRRDFIHADDVARAYISVLNHYTSLDRQVDEFEVGTGRAVTVRSFVELAKSLCGSSSQLRFGGLPMRTNEIMESFADTTLLNRLGWEPKLSLEAGLIQCMSVDLPGV